MIEARARFDAPERIVHVRVGGLDGKIYLDLCDENWRAVEIDADGWRVIDTPPVRFRRSAGMLPLPVPVAGGSIEELRPFLNVRSNNEFVLTVAWMLAALRDLGPYPVLALFGEHGTAKSTFARILRALIDPNTVPLRALPREDRDLFIAATNGHVLVFDNISSLADWISDTLCRLSTGGGFATRQLYTDQDEVLLNAIRPAILNGIEEVVNRPDLADRAIFLTLEPIPNDKRKLEAEMWAAFEAGAAAHSRCAARRGGDGPQATARDPAEEAAAHGGFRDLGDGLRDRAAASGRHVLGGRHLREGLRRQHRRGGGDRPQRQPGCHRGADFHGGRGRSGPGPPRTCWSCWARSRGRKPSRPRPGRPTPRGSAASCARRRPSCARSASRSILAIARGEADPDHHSSPPFFPNP